MSNIFHIKPIYKEFIWGGRKLIDYFHLPQSLEQIGTIYHVIAVPGHLDNLVEETGEPLSVFYQTNPALFRCNRKDLPIRMTTTCNEGRQSLSAPSDRRLCTGSRRSVWESLRLCRASSRRGRKKAAFRQPLHNARRICQKGPSARLGTSFRTHHTKKW